MLENKTIHELRGIAQSFGINDIFEKDAKILAQEIENKQQNLIPEKTQAPELPKYDASLMTAQPSELASPMEILRILEQHLRLGLKLRLNEESWQMSYGKKTDEGTMRMPLSTVLKCANKLMS